MKVELDIPWKQTTRQVQGMKTEKEIAKARGARLHPRSGAGRIKDDASTSDKVLEIKDANKTHSIKGSDLAKLHRRASQQGKNAEYIIYFTDDDLTATLTITKGKR